MGVPSTALAAPTYRLRWPHWQHAVHGKCPHKMAGRNVRTKFTSWTLMFVGRWIVSCLVIKQTLSVFDEGQQVLVGNYRPGRKWVQGEITVPTRPVSYRVRANETVWRRHADQLHPGPRSNHDPGFEAGAGVRKLPMLLRELSQPPSR